MGYAGLIDLNRVIVRRKKKNYFRYNFLIHICYLIIKINRAANYKIKFKRFNIYIYIYNVTLSNKDPSNQPFIVTIVSDIDLTEAHFIISAFIFRSPDLASTSCDYYADAMNAFAGIGKHILMR